MLRSLRKKEKEHFQIKLPPTDIDFTDEAVIFM